MSQGSVSPALRWLATLGAVLCATSVALGAFGAHGLADRLDAQALGRWATASRYLVIAGLGAILPRLVPGVTGGLATFASAALVFGGVVFATALYLLALGAPGLFGAVAPIGGLGMIAGFLALAAVLFRAR